MFVREFDFLIERSSMLSLTYGLRLVLSSIAFAVLTACGGGSTEPTTAPSPTPSPSPTPTPTTSPTPTPTPTPSPTPTACTAAATGATGYSLVFKGCSAANVAEYYDKTECVRDNATGLIWQGQTGPGTGIRGNFIYQSNYDSTTELQKYNLITYSAPTQTEIDKAGNSISLKNDINASNLCGSSGWRLPTINELQSIVRAGNPSIDLQWFPNTASARYWTSTPTAGFSYKAGVVNFSTGAAGDEARGSFGAQVRLVR